MGSRNPNKSNQQIQHRAPQQKTKERETSSVRIKQYQEKETDLGSNNLRMAKEEQLGEWYQTRR